MKGPPKPAPQRIEVVQRKLKQHSDHIDLTIDVRWQDAWRHPSKREPANWNAAWIFIKYRQLITQQHNDKDALLTHIALDEPSRERAHRHIEHAMSRGQHSLLITGKSHLQSRGGMSPSHEELYHREARVLLKDGGAKGKTSYHSQTWSGWQHAKLTAVTIPKAAKAAKALPKDGMGVFIYRSTPGQGALDMKGIRLRFESSEVTPIQLWSYALEMIYIPEGAFDLGDPGDPKRKGAPTDAFHRATRPKGQRSWVYRVKSEKKIRVVEPGAGEPGLTWNDEQYGSWGDIPRAFPKGHRAFYCMRTQLTQGHYADFINSLSGAAKTAHFPYGGQGDYRYTIYKTDNGRRFATRPNRACNWVSWGDFIAYAWWAGLRPLTELEWEKACRGKAHAVNGEYAWGTTKLVNTNVILGDESAEPIVTGNCHINSATNPLEGGDGGYGPVPSDAFLINGGTSDPIEYTASGARERSNRREVTGASYYRVMAMSGNLWDFVISAGVKEGRDFTGINGNGRLTDTGEPDWGQLPPPWPSIDGRGSGFRGGSWYTSEGRGQVADRTSASGLPGYVVRSHDTGIRAGRTAPHDSD